MEMKAFYKCTGLGVLCGLVGKTRQAFYEYKRRIEKAQFEDAIIVDLVKKERRIAKRVGGKKLFLILKKALSEHDIKIGRDKFLDILRDNGLLVKRRRRRIGTTMSRHRLRKYPNLSKGLKIDRAEQLWVSDITYLKVGDTHCYLILITDAYSRKVVGYNFGRAMNADFCVRALKGAIAGRCYGDRKLMHHSDRGLQYCSEAYVKILKNNHICISIACPDPSGTENGDPLENPLAERMNRIFKDNFALDVPFATFEEAQQTIRNAIDYYNNRLPHSSVDMLTPKEAHHKTGDLKKHWKWYWKEKQEAMERLEAGPEAGVGIPDQAQN